MILYPNLWAFNPKVSCHVEAFGFGVNRSDVVQIAAAVCDGGGRSLFVPVYQPELPDDVQKQLGFLTQTRSGKRRDEEEVRNE